MRPLLFLFSVLVLLILACAPANNPRLTEAEAIAVVKADLQLVRFVNNKVFPSQCAAAHFREDWWHAEWSAKEKVWLVGRVPIPRSPVFKPGWRVYENTLIVEEIKGSPYYC